ncbi:MAG: DNA-methyltransferase [Bacillota bacterium]
MNWTLIEGNCLQVMQQMDSNTIDAVIADPPYSSGGLTHAERTADPIKKYILGSTRRTYATFAGDNRDQRSWTLWMTLWLSEAARLLRQGGRVYVFSDWRQLPATTDAVQAAGLIWRGIIPWDKGRGARAPHTGYHRHQCEYVVFATQGRCEKLPPGMGGPFDGCIRATVPQAKRHPTEKPGGAIAPLVSTVPLGGVILDPFAGSGTTLEEAVRAGRRAIGIEIEPHYCDVIRHRMTPFPQSA